MVEPELTEVGELHSLTDWQVSEASEEAELDEFCSRGGTTRGDHVPPKKNIRTPKNKKMGEGGGRKVTQERETDRHVHREGKDGRSRVRVISPQSCTYRGSQALERKRDTQRDPDPLDCGSQDPDVCVCVVHRLRGWPGERGSGQGAGLLCSPGHFFLCHEPRDAMPFTSLRCPDDTT